MQSIVNWIRSLMILYFLMMILLYFTAGASWQKPIRFFMGLVLLLTIAAPVLRLFGGDESLLDQIQDQIQIETFQQYEQEVEGNKLQMDETAEEEWLRTYLIKEYGLEGQVPEE